MKLLTYLCVVLFSANVFGQLKNIEQDSTTYYIVEGDSLYSSAIDLEGVFLLKKIKFCDRHDRVKYLILKRKVIKVYPYAKLAAEKLMNLQGNLKNIKKKSQQKRYTKRIQKYIEQEFSAELKKLTRTEGQILVKLIHRQTGMVTFDLVKEIRSGWRAFWYNTTAKMFDISLKQRYDPENIQEDYYIEDILTRAFMNGKLESQPSALDLDFLEMSNQWVY